MADGTPKPVELIKGHRTKAEKTLREDSEKELVTGSPFFEWPEVRNNPISHKQFIRLKKLFRAINKDDGLVEPVINRYCLLMAECVELEMKNMRLIEFLTELEEYKPSLTYNDYIKNYIALNKQIQANDRLLLSRRKMLLDIEKENIMTTLSQLRSIPKKISDQEEQDPMEKFLKERGII